MFIYLKPLLICLCLLSITACSEESNQTGPNDEYMLVWEDQFEDANLDTRNWSYQLGTGSQYGLNGWGNNELQYYTDRKENVFLENGFLVIEARKEAYEGMEYTSGRIRTSGKKDYTYGKFEMRAKLPETQGIWPAFWLLPTDNEYGGWPASGEIDIMELLGHQPDTVYGTIHFGDDFPNRKSVTGKYWLDTSTFADDFHTYTVEWEPDTLTWFIDGQQFHQVTRQAIAPENWPFDKRFHLILNVAVGGNWPGYPDESTRLPQRMIVDYIKVYQKEN